MGNNMENFSVFIRNSEYYSWRLEKSVIKNQFISNGLNAIGFGSVVKLLITVFDGGWDGTSR